MPYEEKEAAKADDKKGGEKILKEARDYLKECVEEESSERAKMLDDLKFCTLDQWPADIRNQREDQSQEGGARPCLTIDKINQYIVQVVNDMRQGKPGINVRPQDDAADIETAKILKGLIRNIEDQSKADIAYATAAENAAKIGLGYFRITTEYVSDDSFDQEIFIRPIPNTFSVYLGKHILPDGSDAEHGFIVEQMPVGKFKEMFPKAKAAAEDFDDLDSSIAGYWYTQETITVVEYFCLERSREELYFLEDGTTISAADYAKWPEDAAAAGPKPAIKDKRSTFRKQLKWRKMTGVDVLEQRDLPGKYIPIVEMVGREAWVEGRRVLWGLVRPAKDSLRMYNYFASAITEKMGLAPKTPYIGAKGQFAGVENRWKNANQLNYPYLEYEPIDVNGNALPAPVRQGATPIEAALLQQMQVIEHDVQTSLGMFKAATGESESQQSGRAILALQRESDTGTYHFGANQAVSIRHAGVIIVDLIPHYYDTKRIVRILGEDGEIQTAMIDPEQEQAMRKVQTPNGIRNIFNPGVGKYDVSITVGPSYNTKRMEAAATFVELAKGSADPASAAVLRYLTVQNSDFNGSDRAAKMLKALLPPGVADEDPIPPKAMAQIAQMQQGMQQMQEAAGKLQQENAQLKAKIPEAQMKIAAETRLEQMRMQMEERDNAMQRRFEEQEARREAEFERWKALLEAATEVKVARIKAENQPEPAAAN
jgi:hypothetical protein